MPIGKSFIDNSVFVNSLPAITKTTPVTVTNPTAATDTQMMELALPKGYLNTLGEAFSIRGGGVFSTTAASSPQITITAKLCTVSGCGSGTVVPLAVIQSGAASATAATNNTWSYSLFAVTSTTGATGNLQAKADPGLVIDLSNVTAAADTIYADQNTGVSNNIDLTAALFLDFMVQQSTTGASNSYKQLSAVIAPQSNPVQTTGGGGSSVPVVAVDTTGLTANVGATTLVTTSANGYYRISAVVVLTTAATTSSNLPECDALWTDADSSVTQAKTVTDQNNNNLLGEISTTKYITMYAKSGTTIQYQTAGYASVGATAAVYAIHLRLEGPF